MDFRVTDAWADPLPEAQRWHTERLLSLADGFLVYDPPSTAPPVSPAPQLTTGRITFGCFNNLAKLSPTLLSLWARLLGRAPGSRLLLKNKALVDPPTQHRLMTALAAHGVTSDQVVLRAPQVEEAEHLSAYAEVDVALDSYPYHGTTTTCEALWM